MRAARQLNENPLRASTGNYDKNPHPKQMSTSSETTTKTSNFI